MEKNKEKKSWYARLSYPKKRVLWGVLFLTPWAIGVLAFFLLPLIKTFYYSLFNMTLQTGTFGFEYVGIENFKYILTVDPEFNQEIITVALDLVKSVPFQIFVSLFVAMMLNGEYAGRGFFRVIFFIPIILATGITNVELSTLQVAAEESQELVNADFIVDILSSSGIPVSVLTFILELVDSIFEVITTAGVQMLIFLSGLQAIAPSLYEVAKIEGCSKFEVFCKITLPMISPMILVCMVYSLAETFAAADISDLINKTMFTSAKYGVGAAMSVVYFFFSVGVTLICSLIVSKVVFYYDN